MHKERVDLGNEAKKLIDNPILKQAFRDAKENAVKEITNSEHNEQDLREHQYLMLSAINNVEKVIINLIRDGEASRHKLNNVEVSQLKPIK
jgi:hypothetical protein